MRKFFDNAVALEGLNYDTTYGRLSMEEMEVMGDEAQADAVQVDQELNEAERIIEVSDALEDLAVIADNIEEATPTDLALVDTVATMAVAGTDVTPEAVTGNDATAMESFVGRRIATEGIKETARNIWENILKFLKSVWTRIESFFYKIFGTIPRMRKRVEAARKEAEEAAGKTLESDKKTLTLTAGVNAMRFEAGFVKNAGELKTAFSNLEAGCDDIFKSYSKFVAKKGEQIAQIIGEMEAENAAESADKILSKLKNIGKFKPAKLTGGGKGPSMPGFETAMTKGMLGGKSLMAKDSLDNPGDSGSSLAKLEYLRRSSVSLANSQEKPKDAPNELKFTTMAPAEMEAVLEIADKILDRLEDFKRNGGQADLVKGRKAMESASDKANAKFAKVRDDKDNKDAKAALPYFKAMVNFNTAYARWAQEPAMPLFSHALDMVSAVLKVVGKSTAAYK